MIEPQGAGALVQYRFSGRAGHPDDPTTGRVEHALRNFEGQWEVDVVADYYDWESLPAQPGTLILLNPGMVIS